MTQWSDHDITAAMNLKKQYEWTAEESQWVKEPPATVNIFINAFACGTTVCFGKRDRSMTLASLTWAS